MISNKYHGLILIFLILTLKHLCCSSSEHGGASKKTMVDPKNGHGQGSYDSFDKFMLSFVNSFKARLDSSVDEVTPKEERTFFLILSKLVHIRREMKAHLLENAWYLRRGR